MLRIALCNDNRRTVQHYSRLIADIAKKHCIDIETSYFDSGEALIFQICESRDRIDIIYLDIAGKSDGIDTARRLRDRGCTAQIIFLTSRADYVYEAFDVGATQYLLRDSTDAGRFERALLKAAELALSQKDELFTIEFDGKITAVPLSQIAYFEIWKRLVTIYYGGGQTGKFYGSMEQLEKQLAGKGFVRAHRSYLVHLPYIAVFQNKQLLLKTGETIPVGITYVQALKQAFADYVSRFRRYGAHDEEGVMHRNGGYKANPPI